MEKEKRIWVYHIEAGDEENPKMKTSYCISDFDGKLLFQDATIEGLAEKFKNWLIELGAELRLDCYRTVKIAFTPPSQVEMSIVKSDRDHYVELPETIFITKHIVERMRPLLKREIKKFLTPFQIQLRIPVRELST